MKLQSFNEHIHEAYNPNDERYSKLRQLGLTDEPEMDDRRDGLLEEWGNDPEIFRAMDTLTKRTTDLIEKWFPSEGDPTAGEHFDEYVDMLNELNPDELGFLEYIVLQHHTGYL